MLRHFLTTTTVVTVTCLFGQSLPQTKPANGKTTSDLVESLILRKEFKEVVEESLAAARKAGEPVPENLGPDEFAALLIKKARKEYPKFLLVTPEVEQRWEKGKFDEPGAFRRIEASRKTLRDFNIALPKLHQRLLDQYKKFTGARLELTAQLLEVEVAKFVKGLEPGSKGE